MKNSEKACDEFLQTIHSDAYYSGLSESEQKLWNTAWQAAIEFAAKVCRDVVVEDVVAEKVRGLMDEGYNLACEDCSDEIIYRGLS